MEIQNITLLTEEQYLDFRNNILGHRSYWIQGVETDDTADAGCVCHDGVVRCTSVRNESIDIAPALVCDLGGFLPGDKILFAGHTWTVLSDKLLFIDDSIGQGIFNKHDSDRNEFFESHLKNVLDNWLDLHRSDEFIVLKQNGEWQSAMNIYETLSGI